MCVYWCVVVCFSLFTSEMTCAMHDHLYDHIVCVCVSLQVYAGLEYYAEPADIWSCGIVLVALLAGGRCIYAVSVMCVIVCAMRCA